MGEHCHLPRDLCEPISVQEQHLPISGHSVFGPNLGFLFLLFRSPYGFPQTKRPSSFPSFSHAGLFFPFLQFKAFPISALNGAALALRL
jgi:hypothetical protein